MRRAALFLAALLVAGPLSAEAWPRGAGNVFAHFGATTLSSDTLFDPGGSRVPFPGRGWEEKGDNLYIEVGLSKDLTLVTTLPLKKVVAKGLLNDFQSRGLADLDLRLRASRPLGSGLFVALDAGALISLGYDREEFPALGSGETDVQLSASLGVTMPFLPGGFASLDLGYRWRRGSLSDEIPFAAKVGAFPHRRVGLFLFGRGHASRADFSRVDPFVGYATDSGRLALGFELYVRASKRFDVNGSWSRVVRGRNTVIGDQLLLGVAFHTKLF